MKPLGCAGSKGSEPSSAEPRLSVSSAPGCLPPAVLQGGMGAARPRDPCQGAGGFPRDPARTRDDPCQPLGVPGGVRVCPCEAGPDFGTLPAEGAWPRAWLGAGQ